MKISKVLLLSTLVLGMTPAVHAGDNLLLTGVKFSEDTNYVDVGAILPLQGALDDTGFRVRLWASYIDFDYDRKNASSVNVNGPTLQAAIGYQWALNQTRISTYIGSVYRNFSVEKNAGATDLDKRWGIKLQGEIDHHFSDSLGVAAIASHTTNLDDYWGRVRPYCQYASGIQVGPELVAQGGNGYDIQQYGIFVQGFDLGFAKMGASIGSEHNSRDGDNSAYGGVNLNIKF